jgi:hypothetical protein
VTGRVTRLLGGLAGAAARVLPPARREWAEALRAEAGQVPAGWRRAGWLAGGLWLVIREAGVARRIVYGLGLGVVAGAAAWAVWLAWRAGGAADPESAADRVRVLAGVSALVVLPWAGRRGGVLGPAGSGLVPRLVRIAGCAAVCGAGVSLVRWDASAGRGGVLGSGAVSWPRETAGLALLAAAAAAPPVIRALAPRAGAGAVWPAAALAALALAFVPLQALTVAYVAGILAVTSRRSPLAGAGLAASALAGAAACLAMYAMVAAPAGFAGSAGGVLLFFLLSALACAVPAAAAGAAAARLARGAAGPRGMREQRIRRGLLAGMTAGAAGGLLITACFAGLGFMMIVGPLAGAAAGALGGAVAARPPEPLPDGSGAAGRLVPGP